MLKKLILILVNMVIIITFLVLYGHYFKIIESVTRVAERKFFIFVIPVLLFIFNYCFEKHIIRNLKFTLSKILIAVSLIILMIFIGYPMLKEISP